MIHTLILARSILRLAVLSVQVFRSQMGCVLTLLLRCCELAFGVPSRTTNLSVYRSRELLSSLASI